MQFKKVLKELKRYHKINKPRIYKGDFDKKQYYKEYYEKKKEFLLQYQKQNYYKNKEIKKTDK